MFMPVLQLQYVSNYYLVGIDYGQFFTNLGIPGFGSVTGTKYFLASKFSVKYSGPTSGKSMIQGKPGILVQDAPTPYYTYEIEAPLLINNYAQTGFMPYNSLHQFAMTFANFQWQLLHGFSYPSTPSSTNFYVVLKSYSIDVTDAQVVQRITIESSVLLSGISGGLNFSSVVISPSLPNYNAICNYIGRVVKNYDIYANMNIVPVIVSDGIPYPQTSYLFSTGLNIYLNKSSFKLEFKVEAKYFLNTGSTVVFIIKDYELDQSYGLVGFETSTLVDFFNPAAFAYYYTTNTIIIGEYTNLATRKFILEYQAPMLVKSKTQNLNEGALVSSDFDFSLYGAPYGPLSSGTPYGGNLLYSNLPTL